MTPPGASGPEQAARKRIDANLDAAGWQVQDRADMNLAAGRGVAVREFKMAADHGYADYLLFVDEKPVGVIEAKRKVSMKLRHSRCEFSEALSSSRLAYGRPA